MCVERIDPIPRAVARGNPPPMGTDQTPTAPQAGSASAAGAGGRDIKYACIAWAARMAATEAVTT